MAAAAHVPVYSVTLASQSVHPPPTTVSRKQIEHWVRSIDKSRQPYIIN